MVVATELQNVLDVESIFAITYKSHYETFVFQETQTTKFCTAVRTNAAALRSRHHAHWIEDTRFGSSAPAANICSGVRPRAACITSMQIRLIAPRPPITHRALNLHRLVSHFNPVYLLVESIIDFF